MAQSSPFADGYIPKAFWKLLPPSSHPRPISLVPWSMSVVPIPVQWFAPVMGVCLDAELICWTGWRSYASTGTATGMWRAAGIPARESYCRSVSMAGGLVCRASRVVAP